jgi:hypothetical protein
MLLTIHHRALLRGMLAGAVALAGASACSRSDRADAGRDTTQTGAAVTPSDTQPGTATQPAITDTASVPAADTAAVAPQTATPSPRARPTRPPAAQDSAPQDGQQGVSGYRAMGHDTSATPATGDSAQVSAEVAQPADTAVSADATGDTVATEMAGAAGATDTTAAVPTDTAIVATDTTAVSDSMPADHAMADTAATGVSPDTTTAGYEPMARDTSVTLAQGDSIGQVESDTAVQTETDTAAIQVQADTTTEAQTELDSTETLGQAPPDQPPTDQPNYDVEAVGDANGDVVGAAQVPSIGNIATGADAVALMTREGEPCRVEDSRDVQWDLASSPATLNPCGSGTMTLPKVQTGEKK